MTDIPTSNELIKRQMKEVDKALYIILKHEMEKRKKVNNDCIL
jgi:hypothetical protein